MKIKMNNNEYELFNHISNYIDRIYIQQPGEYPIVIATEGANGMPLAGWHSHRLPVIGDWKTIQGVMDAYGIEVIE